mgnify:CR=1 FL=1
MNEAVLEFLETRRCTSVKLLADPGPNAQEVERLLTIASRVPDHGKLAPWYFIIFEGEKRAEFGEILRTAYTKTHPEATEKQLDFEAARLTRAPLVVAVISRLRPATIPAWEQFLSSANVCHTLTMAAHAMGYGANWLSEWMATDDTVRKALNLQDGRDHIAGFIYIGSRTDTPEERVRPDLPALLNHYGDALTNKGDQYGREGLAIPDDTPYNTGKFNK